MKKDKPTLKWEVNIFGKLGDPEWEISVVRSDNDHGKDSWGWGWKRRWKTNCF